MSLGLKCTSISRKYSTKHTIKLSSKENNLSTVRNSDTDAIKDLHTILYAVNESVETYSFLKSQMQFLLILKDFFKSYLHI